MSSEAEAYVEASSPYKATTYLIHYRMAVLANETRGYTIYMGDANLAKRCRTSVKTVQRARDRMIADGYLTMIEPAVGQRVAVFQMLFPNATDTRLREVGGHFDHPVDEPCDKVGGHFVRVGGHFDQSRWTFGDPSPIYTTKENKSTSTSDVVRPEATHLATLLADLIEANGSRRPSVTTRWVTEMDRLLRLDHRDPVQADQVLRWCQADEFWRSVILSPVKFRAKYDALRLRMTPRHEPQPPSVEPQPPSVDDWLRDHAEAHARSVPMPDSLRQWKAGLRP